MPQELIQKNREETLTTCKKLAETLENAKLEKTRYLIGKIREDVARRRNRLPKFLHWIFPEPSHERIYHDIPVHKAGWSLTQYLEANFDADIDPLQEILELCERSDGENIFITPGQALEIEIQTTKQPA